MTLHGARLDSDELGGVMDGSASSDVGGEHVRLALGRLERELAAKVPVPHASRLAAANHSSRPSIGIS